MIRESRRKSLFGKFGAVALLLVGAWRLSASPVVPFIAPPVAVTGNPGDTVGWGFTIFNPTSLWISFIDSSWNQSSPSYGNADPNFGQSGYGDYIGFNGGPSPDFGIAPGGSWTQTFSAATAPYPGPIPGANPPGTGIAQFVIDPTAPMGGHDTGTLTIHYDTFSGSPGLGGSQVGGPFVLTLADDTTLPTLDVYVGTPEPSAALPLGLLALGWAAWKLRRRFAS
jgi:hypothetical protein